MEDGVLKEGFLVKRVSAPETLPTRLGAGARPPKPRWGGQGLRGAELRVVGGVVWTVVRG